MIEGRSIDDIVRDRSRRWLITGCAGFIGSNLLEKLLLLGQRVAGLDNFSTGKPENLADVEAEVGPEAWSRFDFIFGDIRRYEDCLEACADVDVVLHHAALGSVPESIKDPVGFHDVNLSGCLNMLTAARDAGVDRFIYASSSAVYGDVEALPQVEDKRGDVLSPYALTKLCDELYADLFARCYGMSLVGLRYFNVFGRRQDPEGAYAAVIPKWFDAMVKGERPVIHGDGLTTRDFCHVDNVVQANLLAACVESEAALNRVYNVGNGRETSLNELFRLIRDRVAEVDPSMSDLEPRYDDFRPGDIRRSVADIGALQERLGFEPLMEVDPGLSASAKWYLRSVAGQEDGAKSA